MSNQQNTSLSPLDILQILFEYRKWILVPAVAGAVLAATYALVMPRTWQASQAFIVRAEAAGANQQRLGKFSDLSEMKTLQETILELARSRGVLTAALEKVGPSKSLLSGSRIGHWPTARDIEDFRKEVYMTPPGGAEFGATEVFYLSVRNNNRERSAKLASALCDELEDRLQELRNEKAQSMVAELKKTVTIASGDLATETQELAEFEAGVGADLGELRNLLNSIGGSSTLSQDMQLIEASKRANETERRETATILAVLKTAQLDPRQVASLPTKVISTQPALLRFKESLLDARVYSASLLGNLAGDHPFVIGARNAEGLIEKNLHAELPSAIKGLEIDLQLLDDRDQQLDEQVAASRNRLAGLASVRAKYAGMVASVQDYSQLLEVSRGDLADARATQAAAHSASLISRIDGVDTGVRPVGIGRTTTAAAGGISGLLCGLGLVFLVANPVPANRPTTEPVAAVAAVVPVNNTAPVNTVPANTVPEAPVAEAPVIETPASENTLAETISAAVQFNPTPEFPAESTFGMFQGVTLTEAIRRADRKLVGSRG